MRVVIFLVVLLLGSHPGLCEEEPSKDAEGAQRSLAVIWVSEHPECPIGDSPPPWGGENMEPFTFNAGGDISEPILRSTGQLDREKYRECTGTVQVMPVMQMVINRMGAVEAVLLIRGERNCWVDELVEYYRSFSFEPATKSGSPVCISYIITIRVGLQ